MISRNIGFNRIFVILARGILFHNPDGTLRNGDAYSRVEEINARCEIIKQI